MKRRFAMTEVACLGIDASQEKKCTYAVENTCELCHDYFPSPLLCLHLISHHIYREMARDPSTRILVVCELCHELIHSLPVPVKKQRVLVGRRTFFVRRDLRRALGYKPAPYEAPATVDIAQVYEEYLGRSQTGAYHMGR
ncbi:MAG: hypothetical protein WC406_11280 [Methanoregula sp.]